jgi:hypothetical protein
MDSELGKVLMEGGTWSNSGTTPEFAWRD